MYNKLLSQWFQVVCALRQRLDRASDGGEGQRGARLALRRHGRHEDVRVVAAGNRFDQKARRRDPRLRVRERVAAERREAVHQADGAEKDRLSDSGFFRFS